MADSIPLSNANLLKGLMPVNPHALVPVESLTNSPTSSTGSASVLEWNSNSDSELFQMSSPASAAALTAQPSLSPPLSPFSTTTSPVGSSSDAGPVVDSQYIINWPQAECEGSPQVTMAPVSNCGGSHGSIADIDNVPALNEHPEELNALIEKMFLSDLHETVNKWQSEATDAAPVESASQQSSSSPKSPTPVETPADTSMTSTVLGYVHYDQTKDDKAPMATASPPQLSLFDPPSPPRSAEASIISIAEYFLRKASERAPPAPPSSSNGNDRPIDSVAEERPASANSALSYFSPSTSPAPRQGTAPGSENVPSAQTDPFQEYWDNSTRMNPPRNTRLSASVASSDRARSNSDTEEEEPQRLSFPATESNPSSGAHSPLNYPYPTLSESFRYFNRSTAPISGPSLVELLPTSISQHTTSSKAASNANDDMFKTVPPPEAPTYDRFYSSAIHGASLRNRLATQNITPTYPQPPKHVAASSIEFNSQRPLWSYSSLPTPPSPTVTPPATSVPAQNNTSATTSTATRKPRPPLPALPTAKPPKVPSCSFMSSEYVRQTPKLPDDDLTTPFAQALPSTWGWGMHTRRYSPPSTAPQSDAGEQGPRNPGRESVMFVPPVPPRPSGWNWSPAFQPSEAPRASQPLHPFSPFSDSTWDSPRSHYELQNPINGVYYPPQPSSGFATNPYSLFEQPPPAPMQHPAYGLPHYSPAFTSGTSYLMYPPPPPTPPRAPSPYHPGGYHPGSTPTLPLPPRRLRFASPAGAAPAWSRPARVPVPLSPPRVILRSDYVRSPSVSPAPVPVRESAQSKYAYSSPAPVIPPVVIDASHAGWYTTSSKFSFSDASVTFRVEMTLFNVHRHFFERHSEYFRKLLSTYQYFSGNHVFLPEVKKDDFERLLSIFYPTDLNKPDITSLTGWTSVLALAQKWDMAQLRALAVQNIGDHAWPMEKIIIAHQHGLHNPGPVWLLPAYKAICGRATPLSLGEAEQLDMKTVIGIWEVQHEVRAMGGVKGPQEDERIGELVKERFGTFESEMPGPAGPAW